MGEKWAKIARALWKNGTLYSFMVLTSKEFDSTILYTVQKYHDVCHCGGNKFKYQWNTRVPCWICEKLKKLLAIMKLLTETFILKEKVV